MKDSAIRDLLRLAGAVVVLSWIAPGFALAQIGVLPPPDTTPPGALHSTVCPPGVIPGPTFSCVLLPANLSDFVADIQTAKVLGKALFWDAQAGSDGNACASCHFHAGADNRTVNTLDPGLRNTDPAKQAVWNVTASNKSLTTAPPPGGGPNYTVKRADFPFHQLADVTDRNSAVVFDTDDVLSSQGVFRANFGAVNVSSKVSESCNTALSPIFQVTGINTRQVEPRNTPTVINAIFNFRNFWDGRANNVFNGRNPFGPRDTTAGIDPKNSVVVADGFGGLKPYPVSIPDASLASQAVGPPGSNLEMSCDGRSFENIGRKMLQVSPLNGQSVDTTDSLLGKFTKGNGLTTTYTALITKAFQPKFWNAPGRTVDGYTQMEKNFSLFWGLSIMLYESTLVSDQAPYDQYVSGNTGALTAQQLRGLNVFMSQCNFCHKGAEFTNAASFLRTEKDAGGLIERMVMGDGQAALYDSGFYNIGVTVTGNDIGTGGLDAFGNPLSFAREARNYAWPNGLNPLQTSFFNVGPDSIYVNTTLFEMNPGGVFSYDSRDAMDGAFKTPSLRNVELTGPYFHTGGYATLEEVVDFYNRGGECAMCSLARTDRLPGHRPCFEYERVQQYEYGAVFGRHQLPVESASFDSSAAPRHVVA